MTAGRMTEDDLLAGILDAMRLAGWRAMHIRRSDLAIVQGNQGWPDVFATPPRDGPALAIEAKSDTGHLRTEQGAWLVRLIQGGVTAAVVRPTDYDRALELILAGNSSRDAWSWAWRT